MVIRYADDTIVGFQYQTDALLLNRSQFASHACGSTCAAPRIKSVVQGYFNYYAVPGNTGSLSLFRDRLLGLWWHTLCRRSQQRVPWKKMLELQDRWFPEPRALHPYPAVRFAANHPR